MSSVAAGPFLAVDALLAIAALAKLARPAATARALGSAGLPASPTAARAIGAIELVVAVAAAALGTRPLALLVAVAYVAFATFTIRLIARSGGTADCGCFGADEAPATNQHVALDLGAAVIAGIAAAAPPGSLRTVLAAQPLAGAPFIALAALCTWLGYVAFTLLPRLGQARRDADAPAATRRRSEAR